MSQLQNLAKSHKKWVESLCCHVYSEKRTFAMCFFLVFKLYHQSCFSQPVIIHYIRMINWWKITIENYVYQNNLKTRK